MEDTKMIENTTEKIVEATKGDKAMCAVVIGLGMAGGYAIGKGLEKVFAGIRNRSAKNKAKKNDANTNVPDQAEDYDIDQPIDSDAK